MRQARVIHPLHLRHLFRKKDEDNKCSVTEMPSGGFEIPRSGENFSMKCVPKWTK